MRFFSTWPRPSIWQAMIFSVEAVMLLLEGVTIGFQQTAGYGSALTLFEFLMKDTSLLQIGLAATTVAGGLVTLVTLLERGKADREQLAIARRAAGFVEFKEGATLLASNNPAAQTTGMMIVETLARSDPSNYRLPALFSLLSYFDSRTRDLWTAFANAIEARRTSPSIQLPQHVPTTTEQVNALLAIGRLLPPKTKGWPQQLGGGRGRLRLQRIYIVDVIVEASNLSNCDMIDWIGRRLKFKDCDLSYSTMKWSSEDAIVFEGCDLTRFTLIKTDMRDAKVTQYSAERCAITDATINAQPIVNTAGT